VLNPTKEILARVKTKVTRVEQWLLLWLGLCGRAMKKAPVSYF